jgi:hypothetical protein
MSPLTVMMLLLAFLRSIPMGIRISSAFWRGYHGRVEATPRHVRYHRWRKDIVIPWQEVRLMDRYIPLDRNRHSRYVFITRLDTPPVDHREVDENTIQLQDRPGLLETLIAYRQRGRHGDSPSCPP